MDAAFDRAGLEQRLRGHVAALASAPRPAGSDGHREAQVYIEGRLQAAGFAVRREPFRASGSLSGVNLLASPLPDQPDLPLLIVAAHYDSTPRTPGADDNASAVAALLELAGWVRPLLAADGRWRARLQLAAYDLEEEGLLGSYHHARRLTERVAGMLSLEMLGYTDHRPGSQRLPPHLAGLYPDVGDFIGVVGNQASKDLLEAVAGGLRQVPGLPVEALAVPGTGEGLLVSRLSDHASFWDAGLPALMVTDTSFFRNPHYHQPSDTPDSLDYPFLARVTAGVCLAVRDILQG